MSHWSRPLCAFFALPFLLSCNTVIESSRIPLDDPEAMKYDAVTRQAGCTSKLGSYALPKAYLRIRVGQKKDAAPDLALFADKKPVQVVRHSDPSLVFCLDHLSSPAADEQVKIIKWSPDDSAKAKTGLLGAVVVNVTDQTAYIIRALIRTAFIALTGAPNFAPRSATFAEAEIIADLEFDPFERRETGTVNAQLVKHGICFMMMGPMFDSGISPDQYCNDPERQALIVTPVYKAYRKFQETPADPNLPGLLYRPRHPYRIAIFQKKDPRGRGKWSLTQMATVEMENLSPVLSLGVTRAIFANKAINFVFEQGTLKTACVSKESEALGFVQIPLEIAKGIVSVPAAIVQVKIGDATQQKSLIQAQQQLYQMQQAYMQVLAGNPPSDVTGTIPTNAELPQTFDPSQLKPPADLVPAVRTNDPFGTDLFSTVLSKVCAGETT